MKSFARTLLLEGLLEIALLSLALNDVEKSDLSLVLSLISVLVNLPDK